MLERDYLVKLFASFAASLRKALIKQKKDPRGAADTLEFAINNATDLDGDALLSLSPESMASVLQVTGTDPKVCAYIAHTLLLEAEYLQEAQETELAQIRSQQAYALANAYKVDLDTNEEALNDLMDSFPDDRDLNDDK